MSSPDSLVLRLFKPGDNVAGFSLGDPDFQPLKTFLQRDAAIYHKEDYAKTYVLADELEVPRVWGYLTLICSDVKLTQRYKKQNHADMRYDSFPSIKIARLAIHKDLQKAGHGRHLVDFCVSITKSEIMPRVGCRFLIVDSKKKAVGFYEKSGFTLLDTVKNRCAENPILFMDLHKL